MGELIAMSLAADSQNEHNIKYDSTIRVCTLTMHCPVLLSHTRGELQRHGSHVPLLVW